MEFAVLPVCWILEVLLLFPTSYEKDLIRLNPKSSLIIGESVIKGSLMPLELEIVIVALVAFGMFSVDKSPS